jgi:glycosyltransferase involved in cell wall biosynthesis
LNAVAQPLERPFADHRASAPEAVAGPSLHVLHVVEPLIGGVIHSVSRICRALEGRARFSLLHGTRPEVPADVARYFPAGVQAYPWRAQRELSFREDRLALRELERHIAALEPDVVHAHSSKAGALARLAARSRPVRLVYSPRGYAFLRRDVGAARRALFYGLEAALGRIDHVTVACGRAEYAHATRVARRVAQIPNMVDLEDFDGYARTPGTAGGEARLVVAMCGEIRAQKNFPLFCAIARLCRGEAMDFVWLGGGSPPAGLALPDNVEITGWLGREAVLERLSRADVFCQTSLWEGLPIALLEAMAIGLPVVAFPAAGNRELVVEGVTGYSCRTAEAFARRLAALARDPEERAGLGAAARRAVERNHDAATLGDHWLSVYRHLEAY